MSGLTEFQHEFAAAVLDPHTPLLARLGHGLSMYQNTVMKGLVDVLRANYPTVECLTGAEWFDAVALRYARSHLPAQPSLALYGGAFPAFLDNIASIGTVPYIPWVARLDRLWTEVHFAADAPCLQARRLADLPAQALGSLRLKLHPAARMACYPHSAVSIWQHHRDAAASRPDLEVDDSEEGVLMTRPQGAVQVLPLSLQACAFVSQLQAGMSLGEAAMRLLEADPLADVAALLAGLINAGGFAESIVES